MPLPPVPRPGRDAFRIIPDPLSQVMEEVHLRALFMGIVTMMPPIQFGNDRVENPRLFILTHGSLRLTVTGTDDSPSLVLAPGDVLLLPHPGHNEAFESIPSASAGEQDTDVSFIGLECELSGANRNVWLDFLPQVICLRRSNRGLTRWLRPTVALFETEYRNASPGRATILARLAEIAVIQTIRIWIEQLPEESRGWLCALKDDGIAAALRAIHERPDTRWTVQSLASESGMSRSAFASRFKTLVGESPMSYVGRWRMLRAASMLENDRNTLKAVVKASGYGSDSAFRLNFKRRFGTIPREYRKRLVR